MNKFNAGVTRIVEALIRAYQADVYPPFSGPVKLTADQARRLLSESPVAELPTDEEWEVMVAAGLPGTAVLGLPIALVATDEESTPWANGWRPNSARHGDEDGGGSGVVGACRVCVHAIRRADLPWDREWRCEEGCRCLMVGCVPAPLVAESVGISAAGTRTAR